MVDEAAHIPASRDNARVASAFPPESSDPNPRASRVRLIAVAGTLVGAGVAGATLVHFGFGWRGAAWALAQLLLAFVAGFDVATRRIPNRVTLPAMAVVLIVRTAFVPGTLAEAAAAGAAAFGVFYALAILTRGGFGMGDVKLVALLGLLLGKAVLPGLFVGIVAGGVASAAVVIAHRGGRGHTIAYGPYLCLGAALAVLAFQPPPLV